MCPPPKTYDRLAGVTITGSLGDIVGDVIGRDKITYGIDEERLTAILERFILRMEAGSVLLSRGSASQSTLDQTQQSAPRRPSGLKRDLISQLSGALQELID